MPDEHSEQPQEQEPGTIQPGTPQQDWFLQTLVNMTNTGALEVGMTLLVGGFLVSGIMVGGAKYFEGFAKEFASGFTDQALAEVLRTDISKWGEIVYKTNATQLKVTGQPLTPTMYVHMREARFFNTAGNPIPGNRGVWWRGRLSEVSGFMIGTLGLG
jgi:hypothetical protein